MKKVSRRLKYAWRALSVQALTLVVTAPEWYPVVAPYLGLDAKHQAVITSAIAVGGILGWLKPQPKLERDIGHGDP
jgi:hypothetical protein